MKAHTLVRTVSLAAVAGGSLLALAPASADAAVLIRNDFSTIDDGAGSVGTTNADGSPVVPVQAGDRNTPPWVNPSGHEGKPGSGQAGAYGIASTYDHDKDGGTAEIDIPGFYEVNGWDGSQLPGSLTITTAFPGAGFEVGEDAVLSFWAAARGGVTGATVTIRNVTDGIDVLAATPLVFANTATNWQFNSFSFAQAASYAGDQFQVIFTSGSAAGDQGLELTDLTFSSTDVVPEPASLALTAFGAAALLRRRRR